MRSQVNSGRNSLGSRLGDAAGLLAMLAAFGFIAWSVKGSPALFVQERSEVIGAVLALSGLAYGFALFLVALGWWTLLGALSPKSPPAHVAFGLYSRSQLYKYLPSNVLHYVGRHAAIVRHGVSNADAAVAAVLETGLLVSAAVLVALLIDPRLFWRLGGDKTGWVLACAVASLLGFGAGVYLLSRGGKAEQLTAALRSTSIWQASAIGLLVDAAFFVASGSAFAVVACAIGPWSGGDALFLISAWSACWVIGFVTPGAPAGVGVREALLIAALSFGGHSDGAVLIAAAMRVVTTLGDLVFAAAGWGATKIAAPRPQAL